MQTTSRQQAGARPPTGGGDGASPRGGRHVRRPRRRGLAAGHVLVVAVVCLLVWTLLDADALKRSADVSNSGPRRTVALAILTPMSALAKVLLFDVAGDAVERAVGRDPDAQPAGEGGHPVDPGIIFPSGTPPATRTSPPGSPAPVETNPRPRGRPTESPRVTPPPVRGGNLPPLRRPTRDDPLRILVVGDSFGGDIGIGLQRTLDPGLVQVLPHFVESTGLANSEFYDWQAHIRQDVAQVDPDVVVVMIGGNDFLPVRIEGDAIAFSDVKHWKPAYTLRIRQFVQGAVSRGARVLWVGLPIMGSASYTHTIERLNRTYQRATARYERVTYIDSYHLFADKNGDYSPYLPDANGNLEQVRTADNIHLTIAGDDRLARYSIKVMRRVWHLAPTAVRP